MKHKRLFLLITLSVFAFALVGCVTDTSETTTTTSTSTQTTTTTTTTTNTESTTTTTTTTVNETFTVTFESYDGTAVTSQTVEDGDLLEEVSSTLEDYQLIGWYTDETFTTAWNFSTDTVDHNMTLYALWDFTYTLLGDGTEESPYLVSCEKDLQVIRNGQFETAPSMYFEQTVDLTIVSEFEDIDGVGFLGHYNGNAYTITLTGNAGIFFRNVGEITNLAIVGDIETESVNYIAMLVHYNNGLVENISVSGEGVRSLVGVVGTYEVGIGGAGAIVGLNEQDGIIQNVESRTNVQARVGGGGIASRNEGTITLASSWGTVGEKDVIYISEEEKSIGKFSYAGGIAGINTGLISQSQNRGRVFAQRAGNSIDDATNNNKVFGGIVGYNLASGVVTECYNAYGTAGSTVHADRIVGGIVGWNFGTVTYSYSPANIGGRANIGGIIGLLDESETSVAHVEYCWSNSNFNSGANETDEIGAFLSTDATNWYSVAKYALNCYYHGTRGMAPTGEGNLAGVSVTLDMTALLNTGLEAGSEKWVVTDGSSSGNAKTKLAWQRNTMIFVVEGAEVEVSVPMGNTPAFDGTPEKEGYAFIEWRTDLADSLTKWTPGGITTNQKVYAYFELINFEVEYNLDGGINNENNPATYTYETPTITLLDATREGCTFLGWYNENELLVTEISLNSTGKLVLTAHWQITVPYVTIHFVDETLVDATVLDLVGASITLPALTQDGYRFLGWSLDGTTVAYNAEEVLAYADLSAIAVEGVVTLTPIFEQIFNYTVAYDGNGANGTMDSVVVETGVDIYVAANGFSADGYTFMGWVLNGVLYQPGDATRDLVGAGETATFTAMWISTSNLVVNGDFSNTGTLVSADTKTFTWDNWNVYRNGTTNVPSLAAVIENGELVISSTIATGAKAINFYAFTDVALPNIQIGSFYYASFDAKVDVSGYNIIGIYLRSKAVGSTTYKTVADLITFNNLSTDMTTFSTILPAYANIVDGNTYYLIITLGTPDGGIAGSYVFTIDNVTLYQLGPVVQ